MTTTEDRIATLNAFIEYCRKYGYGSAWHLEGLVNHFVRVLERDPLVVCPHCKSEAMPGYELICCCQPECQPKD